MPTYAYRCEACGHDFDRVQRITEDPIRECPQCHEQKLPHRVCRSCGYYKGEPVVAQAASDFDE